MSNTLTSGIRSPQGALIDLDGTMYRGATPITSAIETVNRMQAAGMPLLFVTNNSSRTPQQVAAHLRSLGAVCRDDQVLTSAQSAVTYITENEQGRRLFVIGEEGLHQAVQQAGLEVVHTRPDLVLQGIDRGFDYDRLAQAVRHLLDGCRYVLTNPDMLLPSGDGLSPGAGAIAAAIRSTSGVEPVLIGKPSSIMMKHALDLLGLNPDQVWVIGDNIRTDIAAGHAAGCRTVLVMTGITTAANLDAECEAADIRPDSVFDSMLEWWHNIREDRS